MSIHSKLKLSRKSANEDQKYLIQRDSHHRQKLWNLGLQNYQVQIIQTKKGNMNKNIRVGSRGRIYVVFDLIIVEKGKVIS